MLTPFITTLQRQCNLSEGDLADLFALQRRKGGALSELLLQKKMVNETAMLEALSSHFQLPLWSELVLENYDAAFTEQVPAHFLKKFFMVPLLPRHSGASPRVHDGTIAAKHSQPILAVADPSVFQAVDDLQRMLNITAFTMVLAPRRTILNAINTFYEARRDSAEALVQTLEANGRDIISEIEDTTDLLDNASDAPVIKLVNHIIATAVKARASDIHIEPYQQTFTIRYRVDGILYELLSPPKWIQAALVSRIKIMAGMNIAEKRLPQDGRLDVRVGSQEIDIRVATLPTSFGERMVLRLLNKSGSLLELAELGLAPAWREQVERLMHAPSGIFLVTGPTGSGKTTTLYAILSDINQPGINIITIEDPVEYQIPGISQIQVNPKIDVTFARGLRAIVRQDPDVILVGEIRDRETADIAVQSALTGHLVFSTLHTNDSAGAITRLVDIGIEPFLISSAVIAVAAQRLIRQLCPHCKAPFTPDADTLQQIGIAPEQTRQATIYRAVGCEACFQTGYRGRIGIFELMVMNAPMQSLILKTFDAHQIKQQALQEGMVTLRQDGIRKVLQGISTIEDVLRVTRG